MNDKKRLEEIKEIRDWDKADLLKLKSEIEAKREGIGELQERIRFLTFNLHQFRHENQRYKQALEEIIRLGTYGTGIQTGEVVRSPEARAAYQALKGESE